MKETSRINQIKRKTDLFEAFFTSDGVGVLGEVVRALMT